MPEEKRNSRRAAWVVGGTALIVALVLARTHWGQFFGIPEILGGASNPTGGAARPFFELLKLVVAALIGLVVTTVHKRSVREKPLSRPLAHAQILFAVAGALVIIIIGESLPRAFGAFGVASIIRFRTPLKDPKDAAILFLLVGLGMACGGGLFAVAGLGALFICVFLLVLNHVGQDEEKEKEKPRYMTVELVAEGREFPSAHIQNVFARSRIVFQPREVSQGKEAAVKYHVALDPETSLDELNTKLLDGGASGIKSVEWEPAKKRG